MSRKQRELDREMRNCKRKETQLKIAQDSLESTQHLFNNAKEVVDLPNPNVLLNQVRSVGLFRYSSIKLIFSVHNWKEKLKQLVENWQINNLERQWRKSSMKKC